MFWGQFLKKFKSRIDLKHGKDRHLILFHGWDVQATAGARGCRMCVSTDKTMLRLGDCDELTSFYYKGYVVDIIYCLQSQNNLLPLVLLPQILSKTVGALP